MKEKIKGYLICEATGIPETPTIIQNNNNSTRILTTLQDGDIKNRNKRVYPKTVIERGLRAPYIQERLRTKTWYGEAGHPLKPDLQRQLSTDHSNISHIIVDYFWEGNKLKGHVESAMTARGKDFQGLILQDSKVAFSLRAVGPVVEKKADYVIVKDPLTVYTFDWVIHPSHACAYMDNIIQESVAGSSLVSESGIFKPIYEQQVIDFAKAESKNFKIFSKTFDLDTSSIEICEGANNLLAKLNNSNDKVVIKLEDHLNKEINNYLLHF